MDRTGESGLFWMVDKKEKPGYTPGLFEWSVVHSDVEQVKGVSRGLTNSPRDCWLRTAVRRPVRLLFTANPKEKSMAGYAMDFLFWSR